MKKMHLLIAVALFAALAVPAAVSAQLTYNSGFQVQNLATTDANIQIDFYWQDGTLEASVSDTVAAGGSNTYFPLADVPSGFNGSVVISSDQDIRAIANVLANGINYGASYSGFTGGQTTVYAPLLMYENAGFNTWFNVQNAGSAATTVNVTYDDGVTNNCNIEPGAACTFDQTTEGHAAGWVGSAVVTAGEPIVLAGMEVGAATLFGYSGFSAGTPALDIPLVNENNSGYITGVQIQNQGAADTDVTLHYEPVSGLGTACDETLTVPAGESATFALYAFTGAELPSDDCTSGALFVGSATVTANTGGENLVAIVNQLNLGANQGSAYEGFADGSGSASVVMPLIMDRNGGYYTGFNVLNVGTANATVACTFSGTSYTVGGTIAPGEAMNDIQSGKIAEGYVGSAVCTSDGEPIVAVVNEVGGAGYDSFLTYSAFNQ
ncbi:MAG: hypothetical protein JW900_13600 [Anaerolineae bacterium]|nr:hypothetical protein [Anaerolineae bacterium]